MILTKTPFRISFFGGGTDYPVWYNEHGGAVLSTTIDKYCYLLCRPYPPFFENTVRVVWSKIEMANQVEDIEHPSVKGVCQFLNIRNGIEIHHAADLPARSGLGASSSFTVGLLHALNIMLKQNVSKQSLALDAINVEQNVIRENVGSQDQVAAAYGGFNKIIFAKNSIAVEPVSIAPETMKEFQRHLLLFFTGLSRSASEVASAQIKNTPQKERELKTMHAMVDAAIKNLQQGDIDTVGRMLHESWQLKRSLSHLITTSRIDEIYEAGLAAGASGGKILGAGGGGFILFYADPALHAKIKEKLSDLLYVPFSFENEGSSLVYKADNTMYGHTLRYG